MGSITFGNIQIKGVGFGSSGVLLVAMIAGYLYQFEPVPILQDLGIVLFLLCGGLEANHQKSRQFVPLKHAIGIHFDE